ncbi:MAG: glycoside hydrolase family 6 protein [Nocardioides sp.]|nr:glycoside hydrolase family 6 protein [Nocardioides sp.]
MLPRFVALALLAGLLVVGPASVSPGPTPSASVTSAAAAADARTAAPRRRDPRWRRAFYVEPGTSAAFAAARDPRFDPLARTPRAKWLLPSHPVTQVRRVAGSYARAARSSGRTPVVALYAIPGRDCGSYSAGGLTPRQYRAWVRRIAAGLRGTGAIAVVEPDAVAMLGDCAGQGPRARLLRNAVERLTAAGVWTYLDGGHSSWQSPAQMAVRLERSGIRRARGFVTNVANHRRTAAEGAYARAVNRALVARGIGAKRFLVETARNGAGPSAEGWCNASTARVGRRPGMAPKGRRDGFVWVKHPGESDGDCGRGDPPAGQWWDDGALRLLGVG